LAAPYKSGARLLVKGGHDPCLNNTPVLVKTQACAGAKEVGTFDLVLTIGGAITILGVTVTNALGLTAGQLQILSALSTILGPMLTVPWWFEQWQKWRARKRERQEAEKERPAVPFE